jgi:hypothetical protein
MARVNVPDDSKTPPTRFKFEELDKPTPSCALNDPPTTTVGPLYVLIPVKANVPNPDFVSPPPATLELMAPDMMESFTTFAGDNAVGIVALPSARTCSLAPLRSTGL